MPNQPIRRMARLEKHELAAIPSHWPKEEQGRYLWRLLRDKGVDPGGLYAVEYFPHRQCWLLTQEIAQGSRPRRITPVPRGNAGLRYFTQISTELRRTALAAFSAAAARSAHFALFGCKYQLPSEPQETTPADLARSLGGSSEGDARVHFTSEGGWQMHYTDTESS